MFKSQLGRVAVYIVLALATIALAYFLGTAAGNYVSARKADRGRQEKTLDILKEMQNLAVGDTIPDHEFADLDGHSVRLSEWLAPVTVLTFFEPDCETCINEIIRLRTVISDTAQYRHFIFISTGARDQLAEVRTKAGVPLRILQDRDRAYTAYFGVFTFPFNLVVNKSRKVESVITGIPTTEDYGRILDEK
jgi:peroxiredoxin